MIRSQRDVGVCVIPDPRGYKKSYGEDFLDSLPFTQVRERLEDIAKFLKTPLPPASERKVVQVSTAPAPVVIPPRVVSVPPASSPLLARLKAMAPPPPAAPPAPLSESPIAARLKEMKKP